MYQYQVPFGDAIKSAFSKYCCFSGRASRSEFWWWILFTALLSWVINTIVSLVASPETVVTVSGIVSLVLLLPTLGLWVRRLHDIDKSGWWALISLIPLVGIIVLIVWWCQDSQHTENQYGPVPNMAENR